MELKKNGKLKENDQCGCVYIGNFTDFHLAKL